MTSDAEIDAYIRSTAITAHHPAGTCAMGIGPDSVLDPELRVRGVERLRVVDASAMPDLVSAHINACVLMMAEKAADLIRGAGAGRRRLVEPLGETQQVHCRRVLGLMVSVTLRREPLLRRVSKGDGAGLGMLGLVIRPTASCWPP